MNDDLPVDELPLAPYDPEVRKCPKCTSMLLTLAWRPAVGELMAEDTRDLGEWSAPQQEHLRRQCSTCGFHWYESPVPAAAIEREDESSNIGYGEEPTTKKPNPED